MRFLVQNDPEVTRIGTELSFNAFLEAAQLALDGHSIQTKDLIHLTRHLDFACKQGNGEVYFMARTLFRRLLHENRFTWLLKLISGARSERSLKSWQGWKLVYVVQLWDNHIIRWG